MVEQVQTYTLQLEQVEAALTRDPENEELIKLKTDLEEVLQLTQELLKSKNQEQSRVALFSKSVNAEGKPWRAGDKCAAKWSSDGQYYGAVIDDITEDGQVSVTFAGFGNTEVTSIDQLRDRSTLCAETTSKETADARETEKRNTNRKKQIEYLKKRKLKKQQRFKQLEEEREVEKNKWQSFAQKAFKKKGFVKRSIFASPENASGRVGVGTCGIGGQPMTQYLGPEKWRKGL